MADAGLEVQAVTLWPDHAAAMAANGLRCEGNSGDRTVRLASAGTTTRGSGPCDIVTIATKAFDVADAANQCVPLLEPRTVVQTIQNGLGSAEVVAPILGRIASPLASSVGSTIRSPGHVHHNGMEMIRFGTFAGLPRARPEASARLVAKR